MNLPLADVASPGEIDCGRTLGDTESLLSFSAHGRHMSARALRHDGLSEGMSRVPASLDVNRRDGKSAGSDGNCFDESDLDGQLVVRIGRQK